LDIVLGVSMAPATVRMVLVEGANADGVTVDEDHFDVAAGKYPTRLSGPDQLIAAILGTREGAAEAGHQLTSTGLTWTDHRDAAALATALAARKIENVMLVSAFLAAAALAQTVGNAMDYEYIAMLFVEPSTATLAFIDSADGSITDVYRRPLRHANPVAELAAMIIGLDAPETYAEGLFIVGCDVDIVPIKPALEATTCLPVSAPEEPETALARGAALASANAPLFASSTVALAYAQDPGTGEVDPYAVSPGYLEVPVRRVGAQLGDADLAYSAAPDEEADAATGVARVADIADVTGEHDFGTSQPRRALLLASTALAVIFVSAALALEIALALGIRPAVALRPVPGESLIAPVAQAPSPPAAQLFPVPHPQAIHPPALAAAPLAPHMPAPALIAPPVPVPAAPVPVPLPMHAPPAPPVHVPSWQPRMNLAVPRLSMPPLRQSIPQPPMNFPAPQGPPYMHGSEGPRFGMGPGPQGSRFPFMPGSEGPRFGMGPGPQGSRFPFMPGSEGPRFGMGPGPQGPRFPFMPGPMGPGSMGPRMPGIPGLPHFNFPGPSFRF
jgi:hypothetical protein